MRLKLCTFNIRTDCDSGKRSFDAREGVIISAVRAERPDIICWQETMPHVQKRITDALSDMYFTVGDARESDGGGESNPISYGKRFALAEYDMFWLSPAPRTPGSKYRGAGCPRVCTTLTLREQKPEGRAFRVYNTHLDNVGARPRLLGMRRILARIAADCKRAQMPNILAGDFNAWSDEAAIRAAMEFKAYPLRDATEGIEVSFHDFGRCNGGKIDYIFTGAESEVIDAAAWKTVTPDGVYISDHWPLSAELEI